MKVESSDFEKACEFIRVIEEVEKTYGKDIEVIVLCKNGDCRYTGNLKEKYPTVYDAIRELSPTKRN